MNQSQPNKVHQSLFMRAIRIAGNLRGMSDSEFMEVVCGGGESHAIRDERGFVDLGAFETFIKKR